VALLGKLEQFGLLNILQRVETFKKTGLMIMKHGEQWVELYFRDGQLICIGPLRGTTLGERLLYAKVIAPQALQTASVVLGPEPAETQLALTLMDMGLVTHEALRAWATREAIDVIQTLAAWTEGEIYFEDNLSPSPDRLLVALSVSSLLTYISPLPAAPSIPQVPKSPMPKPSVAPVQRSGPPVPPAQPFSSASLPRRPEPAAPNRPVPPPLMPTPGFSPEPAIPEQSPKQEVPPSAGTLNAASLFDMSNLFADSASDEPMVTFEPDHNDSPAGLSLGGFGEEKNVSSGLKPPVHVATPTPPKRIDTSFMQAEMILLPTDLSMMRQQNIMLQITPDQWRVFTLVNGQISLQMMCQMLGMPPDLVCQIAGELIAMGIAIFMTSQPAINELSPVSKEFLNAGLENGYVTPGYTASNQQPWMAAMPTTTGAPRPGQGPIETQSQWGNGANGATFVPGRGWVLNPPPQYPQQGGNNTDYYADGMNGMYSPARN
jgi:hypothetical protein